jgi:hypothetical protein
MLCFHKEDPMDTQLMKDAMYVLNFCLRVEEWPTAREEERQGRAL